MNETKKDKPATIKICWRGIIDEALETTWGGNPIKNWEANIWQEVLTKEASEALYAKGQLRDGREIEESVPEMLPNGFRLLIPKKRWLSDHEAALTHPCFDVDGEEPKIMKKRTLPKVRPDAELAAWRGQAVPINAGPEPLLTDPDMQ